LASFGAAALLTNTSLHHPVQRKAARKRTKSALPQSNFRFVAGSLITPCKHNGDQWIEVSRPP